MVNTQSHTHCQVAQNLTAQAKLIKEDLFATLASLRKEKPVGNNYVFGLTIGQV
jgi:hypothetical protein